MDFYAFSVIHEVIKVGLLGEHAHSIHRGTRVSILIVFLLNPAVMIGPDHLMRLTNTCAIVIEMHQSIGADRAGLSRGACQNEPILVAAPLVTLCLRVVCMLSGYVRLALQVLTLFHHSEIILHSVALMPRDLHLKQLKQVISRTHRCLSLLHKHEPLLCLIHPMTLSLLIVISGRSK